MDKMLEGTAHVVLLVLIVILAGLIALILYIKRFRDCIEAGNQVRSILNMLRETQDTSSRARCNTVNNMIDDWNRKWSPKCGDKIPSIDCSTMKNP